VTPSNFRWSGWDHQELNKKYEEQNKAKKFKKSNLDINDIVEFKNKRRQDTSSRDRPDINIRSRVRYIHIYM